MSYPSTSTRVLDVPFLYEAEVIPGRRYRKPRKRTLRAHALVEAPIRSFYEMRPVLEVSHQDRIWPFEQGAITPLTIYECGGRLYAPLIHATQPVSVDLFAAAIRDRDVMPEGRPRFMDDLDLHQVPVDSGDERTHWNHPLLGRSLADTTILERWPSPRVVASTHDVREAKTVADLTDAYAIVDGVIFARCPEPVWALYHREGRTYELAVERWPRRLAAHALFRLDRKQDAVSYAATLGRRLVVATDVANVAILDAFMLARNDIGALATAVIDAWRVVHERDYYIYHTGCRAARELDDLTEKARNTGARDSETILAVNKAVVDMSGRGGTRLQRERYGLTGAIREGARRWAFEQSLAEPNLFNLPATDPSLEFSAEDMAVLGSIS